MLSNINIQGENGKGDILLIDDDVYFQKVVEGILKKLFNITIVTSGDEGLKLLQGGFKPTVIFCSQTVPGSLTGSEILNAGMRFHPDASRIVLVPDNDPKNVIKYINQSHAFMYLAKDCEKLDVFQAAILGYEYYTAKQTQKAEHTKHKEDLGVLASKLTKSEEDKLLLAETLQKKNFDLEEKSRFIRELETKLAEQAAKIHELEIELDRVTFELEGARHMMAALDSFPNQVFRSAQNLVTFSERLYFTEHTSAVVEMCLKMAEIMKILPDRVKFLKLAAQLHGAVFSYMPNELKTANPNFLDDHEKKAYFKYFGYIVKNLIKIDYMRIAGTIISQMWEHYDGSGMPYGAMDHEILLESQILTLSYFYHKDVYGLTTDMYLELKDRGEVTQSPVDTERRHKEFLKNAFRNTKWYDYDVLRTFVDMVKEKECISVIPVKDTLKLFIRDGAIKRAYSSYVNEEDENGVIEPKHQEVEVIKEGDEVKFEIRKVHPFKAKPGMVTVEKIITVSGVLVAEKEATIDSILVRKLSQLCVSGLIDEIITLRIPVFF